MRLIPLTPVLALLFSLSAWPVFGDAELLGIDSVGRVRGSFLVVFKSDWQLYAAPRSGPGAPVVLPDVLPVTAHSTQLLAEALCTDMHAHLEGAVFFRGAPDYAAFIVHGAPDDYVRNKLAKDPRVLRIGANFPLIPIDRTNR
jgi:hypothetical protein